MKFTEEMPKQFSQSENLKVLKVVCANLINSQPEQTIRGLCRGGSLWINEKNALKGDISIGSLHALGDAHDGAVRQYARSIGAVLLVNFDGLGDSFVFDEDEDAGGNVMAPELTQVRFSKNTGKMALLKCLDSCLGSDLEDLYIRINEEECAHRDIKHRLSKQNI